MEFNFSKETAATHGKGETTLINPTFYFRYAKKINDRLAIGAHWDILGLHYRNIDGLQNNGNYYLSSSDLMLSGNYRLRKLDFGLDVGLLSFLKEGTSFSFSAPQNGLEDGEFNYQNDPLSSPLGFKYFELQGIGKHLKLRTNIGYQMTDRWSLGYQWQLRHFSTVENIPVTMAAHHLTLRYNLSYKNKEVTDKR